MLTCHFHFACRRLGVDGRLPTLIEAAGEELSSLLVRVVGGSRLSRLVTALGALLRAPPRRLYSTQSTQTGRRWHPVSTPRPALSDTNRWPGRRRIFHAHPSLPYSISSAFRYLEHSEFSRFLAAKGSYSHTPQLSLPYRGAGPSEHRVTESGRTGQTSRSPTTIPAIPTNPFPLDWTL